MKRLLLLLSRDVIGTTFLRICDQRRQNIFLTLHFDFEDEELKQSTNTVSSAVTNRLTEKQQAKHFLNTFCSFQDYPLFNKVVIQLRNTDNRSKSNPHQSVLG